MERVVLRADSRGRRAGGNRALQDTFAINVLSAEIAFACSDVYRRANTRAACRGIHCK